MELDEIKEKINVHHIDTLRIDFPDLFGICRSKLVPARRLEEVLHEGINFAQAIYAIDLANDVAMGTGMGPEIEWRDMTLIPDPHTFAVLPHLEGTARFIASAQRDGVPHPVDPRNVLQGILKKYEEKNLRPVAATELEFFVFNLDAAGVGGPYNPNLSNVYTANPRVDRLGLLRKLQNTFLDLGVEIIYSNHEFFPGQFEINWKYAQAMDVADQTFTFKYVCKEIAFQNDLLLTFMSRPKTESGGNGFHIHLSLSDPVSRKNLFHDPESKAWGMSDLMRYFLGGLMAHAKGMSALLAPTINSYKRYVPNAFAPYFIVWGLDNRTVYCRVPGERGPATRIENRAPCASANPYLVYAAAFAAGLDGIENKIDPGQPIEGDIYGAEPGTYPTVPLYLRDALAELKADKTLCTALGPELIQAFVAVKEHELERFRKAVTDWEFNEYSFHF
ncbi:MAG: glutamine synthetase [Deltaproteobacteria bacterium]|nr:glutamine synthetase [Deltaproteobacteria bacterium]